MGKVKIKKSDLDRYDAYVRRYDPVAYLLHAHLYIRKE